MLNASAITYLNLQVLFGEFCAGARRGGHGRRSDQRKRAFRQSRHLGKPRGVPPGGRIEFIVKGPPEGVKASTGYAGSEHRPGRRKRSQRPLATIVASPTHPSHSRSSLRTPNRFRHRLRSGLVTSSQCARGGSISPRSPRIPTIPTAPPTFMITVEGQTPKPFDPSDTTPNIIGAARRRRRLDHRKPHQGVTRFSHPPNSFHAARMVRPPG